MKDLMLAITILARDGGSRAGGLNPTDEVVEILLAVAAWLIVGGLLLLLWGRASQEQRWVAHPWVQSPRGPPIRPTMLYDPPFPQRDVSTSSVAGDLPDDALRIQIRAYSSRGEVSYLSGELITSPVTAKTSVGSATRNNDFSASSIT